MIFFKHLGAMAKRVPMLGADRSPGEDLGPVRAPVLGFPAPASPRPWPLANCNVAPRDTKMGDAYYLPMESILAKSML